MDGKANRRRTREVTLYRLSDAHRSSEAVLDLLEFPKELIAQDVVPVTVMDLPGIWVEGILKAEGSGVVEWSRDVYRTTGRRVDLEPRSPLGLLLLDVEGRVYAIGYGRGAGLIPDDLKDHSFGLAFAVRRLEAGDLNALMRRQPGARGRTDTTTTPAGLPIWAFGVEEHADLVRRVGGRIYGLTLSFASANERSVRVEGAEGLRTYLGVEPADLISDIRTIAKVLRDEQPRPELEFIERIRPMRDRPRVTELDRHLDDLLGRTSAEVANHLTVVVPSLRLATYREASSFSVDIGARGIPVATLELSHFLQRTNRFRSGTRLQALRKGVVRMYRSPDADDPLDPRSGTPAHKWLEVDMSIDHHRYSFVDGEWYEIGVEYLERMRQRVTEILQRPHSVDELPGWDPDLDTEASYNLLVQASTKNYLCLDRKGVKDEFHRLNGVEICDLLHASGALVHVKKASGSAPLSHLFNQALVAVQTLKNSRLARIDFESLDRRVAEESGKAWEWPFEIEPIHVVFAILLKGGAELTADTLFPFAQVALVNTDRVLQSQFGVSVEVIGLSSVRNPQMHGASGLDEATIRA